MAAKQKSVNVILPPAIASFEHLLEPKPDDKGKLFYSVTLLFSKARAGELDPLRKVINEVAVGAFGANAAALLQGGVLKSPIRDGDMKYLADPGLYKAFKGCFFVATRTGNRPQIVGPDAMTPILSSEEVYSGCMIRVSGSVFAYDKGVNKGISVWMNNVQVLQQGTRLDGRRSAQDEFTPYTPPEGEIDPLA